VNLEQHTSAEAGTYSAILQNCIYHVKVCSDIPWM